MRQVTHRALRRRQVRAFVTAGAVVAVAIATSVPVHEAQACGSCRGPGGAGSALTAPWQRWGVSMTETLRVGHGIFDQENRYRSFGPQSHDRVLEIAWAAAYRPIDAIEIGATTAYGNVLVGGPSFRSGRGALGDLGLRVRWEAIAEPAVDLPNGPRNPSLGLTLSVRVPTGRVDRSTDSGSSGPSPGTVGSTATSQGLGTTEVAVAADVRKTFAARWQIGAVVEGALRAPDESIGIRRALGPRGLARLMGIVFVGELTFGAFVDLAAEGNVDYDGRTSSLSSQRAFALGLSASLKTEVGLRAGLALNWIPPIDGLSSNAVAATGITTFLAFTR
ncbi:MAG: hypothetical protein JST00_08520 [Deltaproteobacteria bacterium]|nr:hypothetical protein [Deltaproteobacteria bacterium]